MTIRYSDFKVAFDFLHKRVETLGLTAVDEEAAKYNLRKMTERQIIDLYNTYTRGKLRG